MNAPFGLCDEVLTLAALSDHGEAARIEQFVFANAGSPFHLPRWLKAVEQGTGQTALGLLAERGGAITGWLPLTEVHFHVPSFRAASGSREAFWQAIREPRGGSPGLRANWRSAGPVHR